VERPGGIEVGLEGFLGYRVRDEADNDESIIDIIYILYI